MQSSMSPRFLSPAIILLCSSVAAQVSTPKGFLNREGNSNATFGLGSYAGDGSNTRTVSHRGTAMTFKGVDYRPGNYNLRRVDGHRT